MARAVPWRARLRRGVPRCAAGGRCARTRLGRRVPAARQAPTRMSYPDALAAPVTLIKWRQWSHLMARS